MASYDSTIRLRQANQTEFSGYIVQIIQNYLNASPSLSSTGTLSGVFYPLYNNPSGYINSGQTGIFKTATDLNSLYAQTLNYVSQNYYLNSNPSGFLTGVNTGFFATTGFVTGISGYLVSLIQSSNNGVSSLNSLSGTLTLSGAGNVYVSNVGQTIIFSGSGSLGGGTGNYITSDQTGIFVTTGQTGNFITNGQTGTFITTSQTGLFYSSSNPSGFITGINLSSYVTTGQTGNFVTTNLIGATGFFYPSGSNPSGYITSGSTGSFVNTGQTGIFATTTYVTGVSGYLSSLISASSAGVSTLNSLSGALTLVGAGNISISSLGQNITISGNSGNFITTGQTGNFVTTGQTGSFITNNQTGLFYPASNPSGFITGASLSSYVTTGQTGSFATTGYVTGASGYLKTLIPLNVISGITITGVTSSGTITLSGVGGTLITSSGQFIYISGGGGTGSSSYPDISDSSNLITIRGTIVEGVNGNYRFSYTGSGNSYVALSGGNFGIGTGTPAFNLDVYNTGRIPTFLTQQISGMQKTFTVNTITAPSGSLSFLVGNTSSFQYQGTGEFFKFDVYAYRLINEQVVFSPTGFSLTGTLPNDSNYYYISGQWNDAPFTDGYRILVRNDTSVYASSTTPDGLNPSSGVYYLDLRKNYFNIGYDSIGINHDFDNTSTSTQAYSGAATFPPLVTPTGITVSNIDLNANRIGNLNGSLTIESAGFMYLKSQSGIIFPSIAPQVVNNIINNTYNNGNTFPWNYYPGNSIWLFSNGYYLYYRCLNGIFRTVCCI